MSSSRPRKLKLYASYQRRKSKNEAPSYPLVLVCAPRFLDRFERANSSRPPPIRATPLDETEWRDTSSLSPLVRHADACLAVRMAASPSPPRLSLVSLPTEILKQIVDDVHKQDQSGRYLDRAGNTSRYGFGHEFEADYFEDEVEQWLSREDATIRWSYWYGRGVWALSYVNKQLRDLAMARLIEVGVSCSRFDACANVSRAQVVKLPQLGKLFALYELPTSSLVRHIRTLEVTSPALDSLASHSSAIALLHQLPSVDRLVVRFDSACVLLLSDPDSESPIYQYARRAFARLAPQIRHAKLWCSNSAIVPEMLALVTSGSALETCEVSAAGPDLLVATPTGVPEIIAGHKLSSLSIGARAGVTAEDTSTISPEWESVCLPSLRFLIYESNFPPPAGFFPFVAKAFPQLEYLSATNNRFIQANFRAILPLTPGDSARLPHLRRLSLSGKWYGAPQVVASLLQHLDLPLLEFLSITSSSDLEDCEDRVATFFPRSVVLPAQLRWVHLSPRLQNWPSVSRTAAAAWGAERGILVEFGRESSTS